MLLTSVIDALPAHLHRLLEEAPVIVEDRPDRALLAELGMEPGDDLLCGLHSGRAITERSHLDVPDMPETIHLFRAGIVEQAGGWDGDDADHAIETEIRITLLHEIGHHFGLDEDDLTDLGYD